MPRSLTDAERRELAYLTERCQLVLDFVAARSGAQFAATAEAIRAVIGQVAAKGNLRGLRAVRSDLLDMSRALPDEDRRALASLLEEQAASDPFSGDGAV